MNPESGNIPALDGLRGLAVLLVILGHYSVGSHHFGAGGQPGVMLFFTLSGFLMAYNYMREHTGIRYWCAFLVRRIFRIYPVCITALLYYSYKDLGNIFDHVILAKGIGGFWTIPVEMKFYFVFPLITIALSYVPHKYLLPFLFLTWTGSWFLGVHGNRGIIDLWPYLSCFIGGITLYVFTIHYPVEKYPHKTLWDIVAIASMIEITLSIPYIFEIRPGNVFTIWRYAWFFSPLIMLTMLCVLYSRGIVNSFFSCGPMRFLGKISFGAYLFHFALRRFKHSMPFSNEILHFLCFLLLVMFVAYFVYLLIEVPFNRYGKWLSLKIYHDEQTTPRH